jgi:hypothetical protein
MFICLLYVGYFYMVGNRSCFLGLNNFNIDLDRLLINHITMIEIKTN